jgi:hypothetical protein
MILFIQPSNLWSCALGAIAEPSQGVSAYPWTIIPLEQRDEYMATLESASVKQDIGPCAASSAVWCATAWKASRRPCRVRAPGHLNSL